MDKNTAAPAQSGEPVAGELEAFEAWFKTSGFWNNAITEKAWRAACAWMRETNAAACDAIVEQSKNSLFRSGAKICAGHIRNGAPEQCDVPPDGWSCSRPKGHTGPCAATQTAVALDELRNRVLRALMAAHPKLAEEYESATAATAQSGDDVRERIARALHYSTCWDTAAYPTLESAMLESLGDFMCTTCLDKIAASPQPSPTAVVLDDERAACDAAYAEQAGNRLTNENDFGAGWECAIEWMQARAAFQQPVGKTAQSVVVRDVIDAWDAYVADRTNEQASILFVLAMNALREARAASPQPVAQPVEPVSNDQIAKWARRMTLPLDDSECVALVQEIIAAQPVEQTRVLKGDPIALLIAKHAEELENNEYAYFELAYTRRTEWMAWICSNHRDDDLNRKVIARGQGSTPQEACENAMTAARPASGETE